LTKAMSPGEVWQYKADTFPDFVFQAFNECIGKEYTNKSATVKQIDVINRMSQLMPGDSYESNKAKIFAEGWLNVEEVYRKLGWKVEYDKPGYNESYGAFWVFKG
jgi:hypothetical protein